MVHKEDRIRAEGKMKPSKAHGSQQPREYCSDRGKSGVGDKAEGSRLRETQVQALCKGGKGQEH